MTTVQIAKFLPPPSPYRSLFQPFLTSLGRQECGIKQKLRNSSSLWSQNNEEPFRSKNWLEHSLSATLIRHERKNSGASKILLCEFLMTSCENQQQSSLSFSTVLVRFFFFHRDAKKLNRLNCIQISNQNQPNKQTTSKSSCMASNLNAIQD